MRKRFLIALAALAFCLPSFAAAADNYEADPVHSSVVFRIKHVDVAYFWGRFNGIKGNFMLDAEKPENSALQFQVEVKAIDTGNAKRDEHLRSPDFFNAAQFPTISFKSTSVKKAGDRYEVTGDLTMLGVTKPLTVSLEKTGEADTKQMGHRMGFETTFTLKRSEWGMTKFMEMLGDEVKMVVSVEGQKK